MIIFATVMLTLLVEFLIEAAVLKVWLNKVKNKSYPSWECFAEAARKVAESDGKYAAICSSRCTQLYNLENVRPSIQDHDSNYTRFICISKTPQIYPGADKTSIMATVPHKPGSLYHILGKFEEKGYNLIKLESRPIPATDFEFMFYFDYEASMYHHEFINTLCELDNLCDSMTYLGSYTEKI